MFLVAIDQGTTSTRAIVFDAALRAVASAQEELRQLYPAPGWVEHDPEEIWAATVATVCAAMQRADASARDVAAIGITNQRETTIVWDRESGKPIHNAIVWQDRRTDDLCASLRAASHETAIQRKTGLLLDPYFSATKIGWLLDRVEGARRLGEEGRLAFGTVDSFLMWRLTGGRVHVTDATNAARTLLFNIHHGCWDEALTDLFRVPMPMLPVVRDCAADFGHTDPRLFGGAIRVAGIAGDQQAATIGQGCLSPGMMKATYGTGCFALLHTGAEPVASHHRLLTTIAYQIGGKRTYALEGAIFVAGAAVQWLRDSLGLIRAADELDGLAARADAAEQVYLVPAFVGLGQTEGVWEGAALEHVPQLVGSARPGLADDVGRVRSGAPILGPVEQEAGNGVVEPLVRRGRRLQHVVVDSPQGHRVEDRLGGWLVRPGAPRHQQAALGMRVELPHPLEQVAAGGAREPLSREHEGHVFSGIREPREELERLVR